MMIEKSTRNSYWQCVRGLCILAVIMIHSPSGITYRVGSFPYNVTLILRQFIDFPVAIFIFLAGYFTNVEKVENETRTYVLNRGGRLLIPFCLWSIFYTIISAAQTIYAGENIRWGRIVYRFIVGKAATPFYYIVVLAQFTLLTPILVKEIRKKGMISKLLWLVTPLYIVGLYFLTIKRGSLPRLYETFFPAWFVFYYMGLWIKINGPFKISERFGKTPLVICTIGLSLIEVIVMNLVGIDASFACSQLKCSSLLFAIVLILWLLKKESTMMQTNNSASRILKAFGDCSYGIFYIHCLILIVVEKILILVGLDEIWILYFIVTWLLTSAISLEIVRVVNMAGHRSSFGSKVLSWIGFV